MNGRGLLFFVLTLSGGLYFIYRLGVFLERRHKERCYLCAAEMNLTPKLWQQNSHYWDSAANRWAHTECVLKERGPEQHRNGGRL